MEISKIRINDQSYDISAKSSESTGKLTQPVLLWGREFDGTQDISDSIVASSIHVGSLNKAAIFKYDETTATTSISGRIVSLNGAYADGGYVTIEPYIKTGSVVSDSFVKTNGTSSQFLKADGSVEELEKNYINNDSADEFINTINATTENNIKKTWSDEKDCYVFSNEVEKPSMYPASNQIVYETIDGSLLGINDTSIISHIYYKDYGFCVITFDKVLTRSLKLYNVENTEKLISVFLPEEITELVEYSFVNCFNLETVHLGNKIQYIGDYSFLKCTNLKHINLPASLKRIGRGVFDGCDLYDLIIPDGVTNIGCNLLHSNKNIRNIVIPNSVSSIGTLSFGKLCYNCSSLERFTLSTSYPIIRESDFYNCTSLKYITFPSWITDIQSSAFDNVTPIEIDSSLSWIKNFPSVSKLETLILRYNGVVKDVETYISTFKIEEGKPIPEGATLLDEEGNVIQAEDGIMPLTNVDAYIGTPNNWLKIYVPANQLTNYKNTYPKLVDYLYPITGNVELNATTLNKIPAENYALKTDLSDKQNKLTAGKGVEITSDNILNITLDTTLYKVVSELPSRPAEGDENKLHLVPQSVSHEPNQFKEYVWVKEENTWELLGDFDASVDLDNYAKRVDFHNGGIDIGKYFIDLNTDKENYSYSALTFPIENFAIDGEKRINIDLANRLTSENITKTSGLYKLTANNKGIITSAVDVAVSDIKNLNESNPFLQRNDLNARVNNNYVQLHSEVGSSIPIMGVQTNPDNITSRAVDMELFIDGITDNHFNELASSNIKAYFKNSDKSSSGFVQLKVGSKTPLKLLLDKDFDISELEEGIAEIRLSNIDSKVDYDPNMNNLLTNGVYPWCTLGRPAGSTGAYTLIVERSTSPDNNGYYTIQQTAYGRQGDTGKVYKRVIFYKDESTIEYMDWINCTGGVNKLAFSGIIDAETASPNNLDPIELALKDNEQAWFIIGNSAGQTSGGTVKFSDTLAYNVHPEDSRGVAANLGDFLCIARDANSRLLYKVIPVNDAKSPSDDNIFPGTYGILTPNDRMDIDNCMMQTYGESNMNNALKSGFYPYCTTGRPAGSEDGDWYTCVVERSRQVDGNGFFSVKQTCFLRRSDKPTKIYERLVFYKPTNRSEDNYGEWTCISGGNNNIGSLYGGVAYPYGTDVPDTRYFYLANLPVKYDMFDLEVAEDEVPCIFRPAKNGGWFKEITDYSKLQKGSDIRYYPEFTLPITIGELIEIYGGLVNVPFKYDIGNNGYVVMIDDLPTGIHHHDVLDESANNISLGTETISFLRISVKKEVVERVPELRNVKIIALSNT